MMLRMTASSILVGYDGSPHSEDALALARVMSAATGAQIVLGRIFPSEPLARSAVPVPLPELSAHFEEQRRLVREQLQQVASRNDAAAEVAPGTSTAQGLHQLADELDPGLVVVGSAHRGRLGQVLAGNVALRLLNGLERPLAVAPAGYGEHDAQLRTIGVGFDGSPEARAALEVARRLAQGSGAEVEVIGVAQPHADLTPHPWAFAWGAGAIRDDLDERLRGRLESAAQGLPRGIRHSAHLHTGAPAIVLLEAARSLDLLILGSRGYGPARRVLLGSVSGRVVRGSECPVLVVPRPVAREPEPLDGSAEQAAPA
jgi:nucleotide-binding universal stress UspA family protein